MDKYKHAKHLVAMTTMKNISAMMPDVIGAVMPENEDDTELFDAYLRARTAIADLWNLLGRAN